MTSIVNGTENELASHEWMYMYVCTQLLSNEYMINWFQFTFPLMEARLDKRCVCVCVFVHTKFANKIYSYTLLQALETR